MKLKKALLSLLLVVGMILSLAACTQQAATETESQPAPESTTASETEIVAESQALAESQESGGIVYPLTGDDLELTMWISMYFGSPIEEHSVMLEAEKLTGVHFEFIETNPGAESEQFNLLIAGGDWTDLISTLVSKYVGGASAAIDEGVVYDLTPYLPEMAPDYYALLTSPEYEKQYKDMLDDQGRQAGFNVINSDTSIVQSGVYMRQDWLDELGLDVPETIDEVHDVMVAFKDAYGCTDSFFMENTSTYPELAHAYGVSGYSMSNTGGTGSHFFQVDGVMKSSLIEDGFLRYLKTLNTWKDEGLVNSDYMSYIEGGHDDWQRFATDITGRFTLGLPMMDSLKEVATDPDYALVAVPDMVENKGDTLHFAEGYSGTGSFSVTTNCDNLEVALNWLNFWSTEKGIELANWGVEGYTFNYNEEGQARYTDLIMNNEELSIDFAVQTYTLAQLPTLWYTDKSFYYLSDAQNSAMAAWGSNKDDSYTLPGSITFTTAESELVGSKLTDIETYASENVVRFILGEKSFDEWDAFVAELKKLGIDEVLGAYQAALDRYNNR